MGFLEKFIYFKKLFCECTSRLSPEERAIDYLRGIAKIVEAPCWDSPFGDDVEVLAMPIDVNATGEQQQALLEAIRLVFPKTSDSFVPRQIPNLGFVYASESPETLGMARALLGVQSESAIEGRKKSLIDNCSEWTCERISQSERIVVSATLCLGHSRQEITNALKNMGVAGENVQFSREGGPLFVRGGPDDISRTACEDLVSWLQAQDGVEVGIKASRANTTPLDRRIQQGQGKERWWNKLRCG